MTKENQTHALDQLTTVAEINGLLATYPDLTYGGWRIRKRSAEAYSAAREKLRSAAVEIDLCRWMFRDPRFVQRYRGKQTAYRLKHVAERWESTPGPLDRGEDFNRHNGYICQGSAVAAALLEGLPVTRISVGGEGSVIAIPKG